MKRFLIVLWSFLEPPWLKARVWAKNRDWPLIEAFRTFRWRDLRGFILVFGFGGLLLGGCTAGSVIRQSGAVATAAERGASGGRLCRAEYWHSNAFGGLLSSDGGREVYVGDGEPCPRGYVTAPRYDYGAYPYNHYRGGYDPGGRATLPYWAPTFPTVPGGTGCFDRSNPALCGPRFAPDEWSDPFLGEQLDLFELRGVQHIQIE